MTYNSTLPSQFPGKMDIQENGDKLKLTISGYSSIGYLTAEFTVTRT